MNKAKSIFQILYQAKPIFRKWILLMVDLLIVLFSISIATFVLYLKSIFYSEVYNFDFSSFLWIYYTAIVISPIIYNILVLDNLLFSDNVLFSDNLLFSDNVLFLDNLLLFFILFI